MKTLVLGIGNPFLRDDAIGLRVAEALSKRITDLDLSISSTSLSGRGLLDLLEGFDRVIFVDAIQTGGRPGAVSCLAPKDFVARHNVPFLHNLDFFQTLTLGKLLLPDFPAQVDIVAVEAEDTLTFREGLTPAVERAIPEAVDTVLSLLKGCLARKN